MQFTSAAAAAVSASGYSTSRPKAIISVPRSRRVAWSLTSPIVTISTSSPPLPARSPLRPPPRSISQQPGASRTSTATLDSPLSPETPQDSESMFDGSAARHNSFPSLDGLIDPLLVDPSMVLKSKELPARPDSPLSVDFDDEPQTTSDTTPSATMPQQPTMTKRQHALHELLSSERAYASDLALIRDIHIPLALGLTVPLSNMRISPPNSSGSSSRTLSTSSDSSTASLGPPMTPEDTKIIFGNVTEIALFADMFTEELELALGSVVEGGQGEDSVGALFLRIIPDLERPYKTYITRHPTALQHLHNLPQTPALTAYLAYTQTVASSLSHAWDFASLMIKPVQRLLKYPLLLAAIIDETPDGHPDKENLRNARARMEEVARNVNEGRRRAEVVKDVLTSKTPKRPNATVGVAASVNLSKMKSLRHGGVTAATMRVSQLAEGGGETGNSEAAQVEMMQAELKRLDAFAQLWAKSVVDWGKMMSNVMVALRTWALSFGKVIGLSADQGSEAFDAFVEVVQKALLPLATDLEGAINERLLKDLAHLLMSMTQPLKLLASMNEQEPYHYHLLTMPVSAKNRPPPSLLAASTNYLALRGQLAAELPTYLALLHRGLSGLVRRLAEIQMRFWKDVKDRWAELWEMLRVEGELNVGWEETCAVWCARWMDVDEVVKRLGVTNPVQPQTQQQQKRRIVEQYLQSQESVFVHAQGAPGMFYIPAPMPTSPPIPPSQPSRQERERQEKHNSRSSASTNGSSNGKTVQTMFSALEPAYSSPPRDRSKSHSAVNVATTVGMLSSLNPGGVASSSQLDSGGSLYSVSAPLPLGAAQVYGHGKERERDKESRRHRARAVTDVDKQGDRGLRRTSSQDSKWKEPEVRNISSRRRTHGHGGMADEFTEYMTAQEQHQQYQRQLQLERQFGGSPSPLPLTYETPPLRQGIPRTKSMPLSHITSDKASVITTTTAKTNGHIMPGGYVVEEEQVYYQSSVPGEWEEHQEQHGHVQQYQLVETQRVESTLTRQTSSAKERGRRPSAGRSQTTPGHVPTISTPMTTPAAMSTPPRASSPGKRKSKERPAHTRKRSGSVKSITSFFTGGNNPSSSSSAPSDPQPLTASQRDSWVSKPAKYICQVIHPCKPPASVSYYSFPFFTLKEGEFYEVLQEAGHPSIHPKLPLYVDDGEDCLLLCRDGNGLVGWALASFLEPLSLGS